MNQDIPATFQPVNIFAVVYCPAMSSHVAKAK